MFISYQNILDGIYASSALTTMSPLCAAPLLQPDHEKALRRVIADCLYMLAARFPHSIRLERCNKQILNRHFSEELNRHN